DDDSLLELVRNIDAGRWELVETTRRVLAAPVARMADTADQYALLYAGPGDTVPGRRAPMADETQRLRRRLRALSAVNRQLYAQLEDTQRPVDPPPGSAPAPTVANGDDLVDLDARLVCDPAGVVYVV